jgi:hypothetical protein
MRSLLQVGILAMTEYYVVTNIQCALLRKGKEKVEIVMIQLFIE